MKTERRVSLSGPPTPSLSRLHIAFSCSPRASVQGGVLSLCQLVGFSYQPIVRWMPLHAVNADDAYVDQDAIVVI
ncbi:hypothetical protein T08_8450 [Trichinella sp. T8]|nr:hypothetical protein T08_8450 [Trichinella sp. T8]